MKNAGYYHFFILPSRYTGPVQKGQIFLFTGQNRFLMEQERRRWESEFAAKHGPENLLRRSGIKLSLRELLDDVSVAPFLAEKRLVVIDGLPKFKKPEIDTLVAQLHPSTILLLIEAESARAKAAPKEFAAIASVKDFAALKGQKLLQWVQTRAKEEGLTLASDAAVRLVSLVQGDQQFLEQEVKKLALYAQGKSLTVKEIDEMVQPLEGVLWAVTDALVAGQKQRAVQEAARLQRSGIDANALWNSLLTFLRQMTVVSAAIESDGGRGDIAAKTGIHPYVVRTMLPYAKRMTPKTLRPIVERAVSIDRDLKTGALRGADDTFSELPAALDTVLLRFP